MGNSNRHILNSSFLSSMLLVWKFQFVPFGFNAGVLFQFIYINLLLLHTNHPKTWWLRTTSMYNCSWTKSADWSSGLDWAHLHVTNICGLALWLCWFCWFQPKCLGLRLAWVSSAPGISPSPVGKAMNVCVVVTGLQ